MGDVYAHLSLVLLSVVIVLSILIFYIVRQTLQLKKEYEQNKHKLDEEEKFGWIIRKESEAQNEPQVEKVSEIEKDSHFKSNLDKMLTFIKKSIDELDRIGLAEQPNGLKLNRRHGRFFEDTLPPNQSYDLTELSEYCVPECSPENPK